MRRAFTLGALRALPRATRLSSAAPRASSTAIVAAATWPARFASHTGLADSLRRELEEEQQRDDKAAQPSVPQGWTVEMKAGTRGFTMKRKYENEDILIRYYGEIEGSDPLALEAAVYVTHGGSSVVFDLNVVKGEIVLNNVSFFKDEALAKDETAEGEIRRSRVYDGPNFEELDSDLVNAFIDYLQSRGINDEIGTFIDEYGYWAEQAQYEMWLQDVNRFVS